MDAAGKTWILLEKRGFWWKNMDSAGKTWILLGKQGYCWKNIDYAGKLRRKITLSVRLLLKRGDTETASARGESLEKISEHMINDIEMGNRGADFSGGVRFFQRFLENYDGSFELG